MTQALLLERKTLDRFRDLKHMIGNTPLLAIHFRYRGGQRVIYAKAEHMNMTGSIKDRMAFHILRKAYSCHVSSPTPRTSKRTRRPPARRSGGSCTFSPEIELNRYEAFKRVCYTCFDPADEVLRTR